MIDDESCKARPNIFDNLNWYNLILSVIFVEMKTAKDLKEKVLSKFITEVS
jgi:hypothetical protein